MGIWAKAVCCGQEKFHIFAGDKVHIKCAICGGTWGSEWLGTTAKREEPKPAEAVGKGRRKPKDVVSKKGRK